MRRWIAIVASACLLALTGCGSGGSERDVRRVVERFQAAVAAGDGARACRQLAAPTRAALVEDEQEPCARAVLALDLGGPPPSRAEVYLTSGYAEGAGRAAFLAKGPRGWRISAAGCTPTEPDLPYRCELER